MRKLAHTPSLSFSLSSAMHCGGLAGWHHRDPVAPCGNQRQPMMKDDGRLFPVIETLLMGGGAGKVVASNKKESATAEVSSDVMEYLTPMPTVTYVMSTSRG